MEETKKRSGWIEWIKLIFCGLGLGTGLGLHLYCLRCWYIGKAILFPVNWCAYGVFVTFFHLLEFTLTAIYRPNELCYDSFLVNQSTQYVVSTLIGVVEFWIEYYFFPTLKTLPYFVIPGAIICFFGIALRAVAEIKMEANFSHLIRKEKTCSHQLVTDGVYSVFRHPSYTGWFYYCVGREILLVNPLSFLFSAGITWGMLYFRIPYEEKYLLSFFPQYEEYRKHTHIFIPFIPCVDAK